MKKNPLRTLFVILATALPLAGCDGARATTAPTAANAVASIDQGSVEGDVTDLYALPVGGVKVTLSDGAGQRTAVTDPAGKFFVDALHAGTWAVVWSKAGYSDTTMDVMVNGNITLDCALRPTDVAVEPAKPAGLRIKKQE
jgi:hypothetical protein